MVQLQAVVSALLFTCAMAASGDIIVRFKNQVNLKDARVQNDLNAGAISGSTRRQNLQKILQDTADVSFNAFNSEMTNARMNIPVTQRFWSRFPSNYPSFSPQLTLSLLSS
jgi:hypothetical protein